MGADLGGRDSRAPMLARDPDPTALHRSPRRVVRQHQKLVRGGMLHSSGCPDHPTLGNPRRAGPGALMTDYQILTIIPAFIILDIAVLSLVAIPLLRRGLAARIDKPAAIDLSAPN